VPAARHYIDLDYVSRREIDTKYIGNEFLKKAFSHTLTVVPEGAAFFKVVVASTVFFMPPLPARAVPVPG
ncbi:hypothetical protein JTL91_36105, partial [Pseudomonas aeruginosa]|nr:hypothetical protein [Pseudomonas aeruginosa]